MATDSPVLVRYRELLEKVAAFAARVEAAHREQLACAPGCHDCCRGELTVTTVEAAFLREGLAAMVAQDRDALAARARAAPTADARCPALDDEGRCGVYAHRPLVCRTHGLPIRFRRPGALPVLDCCPKNFRGASLETLPAGVVLDQLTLSTLLGALDALLADTEGRPRGERVALRALLSDPAPDAPR